MEALDKLYIEDPTRGTRRMARELQKKGHQVGRCHVRTLMQIMRLKTVYCRPRTTIIDPAKYKFPYLLRNLAIQKPNQVWSLDCFLHLKTIPLFHFKSIPLSMQG